MPDAGQIPGAALELARKATNENPKGLLAAGAALVALPFAAEGVAKLAGGAREKAADKAKQVAGDAKQKAKDAAGEVAADKLKPSGLSGLFGGGDSDEDEEGAPRRGMAAEGACPFNKPSTWPSR